MPEMLSIVQQLLVAGNETTTKMLTEMMRLLGEHPDAVARCSATTRSHRSRRRGDAAAGDARRKGMFRVVTRDVTLGGVDLSAGCAASSSCSRPRTETRAIYDEPDEFDPDRENLRQHLAFGKGIHFCLGANLSRLEGRVALQELTRRIESFRLPETNEYRYFPSFMLRGLTSLDVEFAAAAVSSSS